MITRIIPGIILGSGIGLSWYEYRTKDYLRDLFGMTILGHTIPPEQRSYVTIYPGIFWTTIQIRSYDRAMLNKIQNGASWDSAFLQQRMHRYIRPVQVDLPNLDTFVTINDRSGRFKSIWLDHPERF